MKREVYAYIPNDDTFVSGLQLIVRLDREVMSSTWRLAGEWTDLPDSERLAVQRDSVSYLLGAWAEPALLTMHDAGEEICACLVEIASRSSDARVACRRLGYTREHLEALVKARARREIEAGELSMWAADFLSGDLQPLPAGALARVIDIHREASAQAAPLQQVRSGRPDAVMPSIEWVDLLEDDEETKEGWRRLTSFVAALIALTDDAVVISVRTEQFDDDVYVQLCREDDGALHLEAVSDAYLEPPLSPDAVDEMHALGWMDPPGDGLENYVVFLEAEQTAPGEVAAFLVETLRRVYSTKPSDLHRFEPNAQVRSLLRGDFGPHNAVRASLSAGRQARLFMGVRFPQDVGPDD